MLDLEHICAKKPDGERNIEQWKNTPKAYVLQSFETQT
jgi:hypothetical protein